MTDEYEEWHKLMSAYADGVKAAPAGGSSESMDVIEEARHRKDIEMMNFRVSEQVPSGRARNAAI